MKAWFESLSKEAQKKIRVALLTTLVFILSILTYIPFGEDLENLSYDLMSEYVKTAKNESPDERVELILIDEDAMVFGQKIQLGRWPWPRKIYPYVLNFLNSGKEKPAAIFFDVLFTESENQNSGPDLIDGLLQANYGFEVPNNGVSQAQSFSGDDVFGLEVNKSGNVVHNMILRPDNQLTEPKPLPGDLLVYHTLKLQNEGKLPASAKINAQNFAVPLNCLRMNLPCGAEVSDDQLGSLERTASLAVASFSNDSDGVYRRGKLLFNYGDQYLPSLTIEAIRSLQAVEKGIDKSEVEIKMLSKNKIQVGDLRIPIDNNGNYLINFYEKPLTTYEEKAPPSEDEGAQEEPVEEAAGDEAAQEEPVEISHGAKSMSGILWSALAYDPNSPVYNPADAMFHPEQFANKVIIIGVSAIGGADLKPTPVYAKFPGPELHTNLISNILQNNAITVEPFLITVFILLLTIGTVAVATLTGKNSFIQFGVPILLIVVYIGVSIFLFRNFNYLMQFSWVSISAVIGNLLAFGYLSLTEGAEKRKYSKVLGNMVDPSIVSEALKDLEALKKGGEQEITAFFSDVAGFSTISEKLDSSGLAALLNEYLSAMTLLLKEHHGTLDKYIGDAIVGIFGAPLIRGSHPHDAAQASLDMMRELAMLRDYWTSNDLYCPEAQQMEVRIGLNTGQAKVGFMGTDTLASYTMMGDTVNLAARLEAAAKDYGVDILISESFESRVNDQFITRKLDLVRVKGKSEPVTLYELVAEKGSLTDKKMKLLDEFSRGVESYLSRDFQGCIDLLSHYQEQRGSKDKAAMQLIERSEEYLKDPPPEHWDGVFTRTHK